MDLGLTGKISIVTASSKGFGKATAKALAAEGSKVVICSRNLTDLESAADEIFKSTGTKPIFKQTDLTKEEDITNLIKYVIDNYGTIHVLVTNCGGPSHGNFFDIDDQKWFDGFNSTLMSVVRLIKGSLPFMQKQKWGRIINITSVSVKQPIEGLLLSNSLRMGVVGLAKTLSLEHAKDNILINNVCPGYMKTDRIIQLAEKRSQASGISKEEVYTNLGNSVPLGRIGLPEELADLITFLASERSSYITGTTISVDGGKYPGY
jgi:3-oxoacyl-[acyl-carrier protein] reductase